MAEQDASKENKQVRRGRWQKGQSGNRSGKRRRPRDDAWMSQTTGLGDPAFDRRLTHNIQVDAIDYNTAIDGWRSDDLLAKAVETLPRACLRRGYDIVIGDEQKLRKGLKEDVQALLKKIGVRKNVRRAHEIERALGGSAIMLGALDGGSMDQPLVERKIRSLDWLNVLEPIEIYPLTYYGDPMKPKFGEPELFQIAAVGPTGTDGARPIGQLVHESRLVIFPGIKVSRYQAGRSVGTSSSWWGDSIFSRILHIVRDFQVASSSAGLLVTDFSQPIFALEGYAALVNSEGPTALRARFQALQLARSIARAIVIDTNERFERLTTSVAGLRDLLDWLTTRLAAALGMPVTMMMGQSPKGLGNEGESDIEFWYDSVADEQEDKVEPALSRIVQVAFYALDRAEPKKWHIKFNPLRQQNALEIAQRNETQAKADIAYLDAGVLGQKEVRESRFGGEWSPETQLDDAAWEEEQEQRAKAEQEALEAAGRGPGSGDGGGTGGGDDDDGTGGGDGGDDGTGGGDDDEPDDRGDARDDGAWIKLPNGKFAGSRGGGKGGGGKGGGGKGGGGKAVSTGRVSRAKAAAAKAKEKAKAAAAKAKERAKAKLAKEKEKAKVAKAKAKAKEKAAKERAKAKLAKEKMKAKLAKEKAKAKVAGDKPTPEDVARQERDARDSARLTEFRNSGSRDPAGIHRDPHGNELSDVEHKQLYDSLYSRLNGPERAASRSYSSTEAVWHVNNHLRGGKPLTDRPTWNDEIPFVVQHLDSAIAKAQPLATSVSVYRGVKKGTVFSRLKPGDTFQDKAYASTSTRPDLAYEFIKTDGRISSGGALLRITLPAGAKPAAIPSPFVHTERELLLARGSKFRVDRVVAPSRAGRPKEIFVTLQD